MGKFHASTSFEVKIALHSLWYHHTYRCDDTRGCVMQFWPPDNEHKRSKHVEAWNKLIVKQKFCAPTVEVSRSHMLKHTHTLTLTQWNSSDHLVAEPASCTTHNKQNRGTSMPSAGFETEIPAVQNYTILLSEKISLDTWTEFPLRM